MAYQKKSKLSILQNQELEVRTLDVLAQSQEAMTIEEIQTQDMFLQGHSPQKMARILSSLRDMGMIEKAKSKTKGKMVYKAICVMEQQGYEVAV